VAEADFYIGSSDLMPRNLDRRVEAMAPITHPALKRQLAQILELGLQDDQLAWELAANGLWHRVRGDRGINSQRRFEDQAISRMREHS